MNNNYFIHFGCWNNGGCPKENDLTKVLNAINKLTTKPDFLTVCGDNYYPTVVKTNKDKKKYLKNEDLQSGFQCLPNDIPIYMTYGNHDFETGLFINENDRENNCTLTKDEIFMVSNEFSNINLKLFQSISFNDNTLILLIDTTIYDEDSIDEYINCYSQVDAKYSSIDVIKNEQLKFIEMFANKVKTNNNVKNVIIVGHHPLAQFKMKKDSLMFYVLSNELNDLLYNTLFLEERNLNYYYLCADLHQYQSGTVTINNMTIKQYIVGTAGAKKDSLNKDLLFTTPQSLDNLQYFMDETDRESSSNKNGYLKCQHNGVNMLFEFIEVNTVRGGRKTKRRIRRRKITKRKYSNKKID